MKNFKRYYFSLFFILFFFSLFSQNTNDKDLKELTSPDGPYITYKNNGAIDLLSVDTLGNINRQNFKNPKELSFPVYSDDKKFLFDLSLHPIQRQAWKQELPEKLLVISDPHGNWECFESVLKGNGVINDNYEWIYGKNHLMIIGDIFDRGNDVLPIFWLTYKLEKEAQDVGGQLSFLLGNHEPMVLTDDLRYAKAKYKILSEKLNLSYSALFGPDTELGRWLGARNTMQLIGKNLFVHAGLGEDFYKRNLTIPQVNEEISKALFLKKKERNELSDLTKFLYGNQGPVWYRGMVRNDAKYNPLKESVLDLILAKYDAERIIVGHTIFSNIRTFYNYKVITVNVDNKDNFEKVLGRGILIENDDIYLISDKGILNKIK